MASQERIRLNPRQNPYTPNAGARPPALVGRDQEVEALDILLERLEHGRPQQSMIVTGLRGVGKTVLLGAFREIAEQRSWVTVEAEVSRNSDFADRMARHARRALLRLAPVERWRERARKAASALKSFSLTFSPDGTVAAGLDVTAQSGIADSGDLGEDLTDLLLSLGEAAQESGTGIVFLFDEIQFLRQHELEALIIALHKTVQRALPITLVGAGLPQIPRLAGEAKSYSERLFTFPHIGRLTEEDARKALVVPAEELKVQFETDAVDFITDYTQGYPYFIQEFGKIVWDEVPESPVTMEDAERALPIVEDKLDESFFRVRADRMTPLELFYMRAMAELGPDAHKAGEVAEVLSRTAEQLGPTRSRLIDKGLLYTPGHGFAAFTVPQFDRYMKRNHPLVVPPLRNRPTRARSDED